MIFIELRVDLGGVDLLPHSFLSITHPDGTILEYGLVPINHSKDSSFGLSGDGQIKVEIGSPEGTHEASVIADQFRQQSSARTGR